MENSTRARPEAKEEEAPLEERVDRLERSHEELLQRLRLVGVLFDGLPWRLEDLDAEVEASDPS